MIQWNLTLTGNQIAILKNLARREFGKPWDSERSLTHWIGGVRTLLREGLIEQKDTYIPGRPYLDQTRSGQFITDRGRFILGMIEADIEKFLNPKELAKVRRLKKAG